MTFDVSNLSNAELELLLNDRLSSLDQTADDLMDIDDVTKADDDTTTLEDMVRLLESQLRNALCKIDQLADQITVLRKENEAQKREICTNCDKVEVIVTDVTEHNGTEHDVALKREKCRKENRGYCRRKNCSYRHPNMTCQAYSSNGFCNNESLCEHRHPKSVCYAWQSYRSCKHGDRCRHRHPVNVISEQNSNAFLWGGFTGYQAVPPQPVYPFQAQQSQFSQRESRW